MENLWAVGPSVARYQNEGLRYNHDHPELHRVVIERIGGIGEGNAGEFLVTTPCGYEGWVRTLNKNPDNLVTCEACLNGRPSSWVKVLLPISNTHLEVASTTQEESDEDDGCDDYSW